MRGIVKLLFTGIIALAVGMTMSSVLRVTTSQSPSSAPPLEHHQQSISPTEPELLSDAAAALTTTLNPAALSASLPISPRDAVDTVIVAPDESDRYLPYETIDDETREKMLQEGTVAHCVHRGMQEKCHFRNLMVQANRFTAFGGSIKSQRFPNPIYPADGQVDPLWKYHKYRGHPISVVSLQPGDGLPCTHVVSRPVIFLFRMSGHSTYHLWENNLGPFFSTLQDDFGLPDGKTKLVPRLNRRDQLIVSFVDYKPKSGPKAPHLLDQLLRTFSTLPLINASRIDKATCFTDAIVGVAANSFPHRQLLYRMMENIAGYAPPPPLPEQPVAIYVSRNHPKVTRGRKIANEVEMLAALNATMVELTGRAIRKVHFEDMTYVEQVKLAMTTNIMFSPHGGGVANCIWMQAGSVMVEFVAPVGKTLPGMYHAMCGKSGVTHFHFLADPDPADIALSPAQLNDNPRLFSNMLMPVERIVENARKAVDLYRRNLVKYKAKRS